MGGVRRGVEEAFDEVCNEEVGRKEGKPFGKVSLKARTAREWLNRLGYRWKDIKKGVFVDGHERADVVEYRKVFVERFLEIAKYAREWEETGSMEGAGLRKIEKGPPAMAGCEDGREIIFVTHDESTFSSNDGRRSCWIKEGESVLRPKGRGKGIMVSDFLTGEGRLRVLDDISDEELAREKIPRDATVYFEYGGNKEGYWKGEDMVKQVLEVGLKVFEKRYGPGCKGCWLFDNSSNHGVFASDALLAREMNLNCGGKQPVMRDGWYKGAAVGGGTETVSQHMWVTDSSGKMVGKGLKMVLEERGLWRTGMKLECREKWTDTEGGKHTRKSCLVGVEDCCARRLMDSQPDFKEQRGMLEEELVKRGHLVFFYPKFHCELNWIEYYWGDGKRRTREACDYTWEGLKKTVPRVLGETNEVRVWRWYKKSERLIKAYSDSLEYGTEAFLLVYKSHRRIKARDLEES